MPNNKYSMTVPVDPKLHAAFEQACAIEGLSLSKGLEVCLDCLDAGELNVNLVSASAIGKPCCFYLDKGYAVFFKQKAVSGAVGQVRTMNAILHAALRGGFGGPIAKAA